MRGVRGLLGPPGPLAPRGPLPSPALTGRVSWAGDRCLSSASSSPGHASPSLAPLLQRSVFLAPQGPLGPLDPLEAWAPPQG